MEFEAEGYYWENYMIILAVICFVIAGWAFSSLASDYIKEIKNR